jgi:hypothetical protein
MAAAAAAAASPTDEAHKRLIGDLKALPEGKERDALLARALLLEFHTVHSPNKTMLPEVMLVEALKAAGPAFLELKRRAELGVYVTESDADGEEVFQIMANARVAQPKRGSLRRSRGHRPAAAAAAAAAGDSR